MKTFSISGRVALVTGGAGGFGQAFSEELVRRGGRVVVTDLNLEGAEQVAEALRENGGEAWAVQLDVTDPDAWEALAESLAAEGRTPSILINNAGIGAIGLALDVPLHTWRAVIEVCFWGVLHGCQTFGRRWRAAGEEAMVINVSSSSAFLGLPQANAYAIAKAGVLALSHTLSCEIDPNHIRFTTVCPSGVPTGIGATSETLGTADADTNARVRRMLEPSGRTTDRVARAAIAGAIRGRPLVRVHPESWGLELARRLLPTRLTIAFGRIFARRLVR